MIKTVNPYSEKQLETYSQLKEHELDKAIGLAEQTHKSWKTSSFNERSKILLSVSNELIENVERLAKLISEEMGKPISQAQAEVKKCSQVCKYYAENAVIMLKPKDIEHNGFKTSKVVYQPLGIIYAIMPWNYPFWQVFRFSAPTLMAGNTALLKHSENVTGCALEIQKIFEKCSGLKGLFQTIVISHSQSNSVIADSRVKAISLTGSSRAGREIASLAGTSLKKTVLELGGSDPYLVMKDADLPNAAKKCIESRMLNGGQSCIAAKRFIVDQSIESEFLDLLISEIKQYKHGNPLDKNTLLGPMARADLRDDLKKQLAQSVESGAKIAYQLESVPDTGYFFKPTILTGVSPGMVAFSQELFGPVASVITYQNIDEAIDLCNDSSFGLGSAIFSRDIDHALNLAQTKIQSGACFINDYVKSDPKLPFGGINDSGYGRELSENGIKEFVNTKTVCVGK